MTTDLTSFFASLPPSSGSPRGLSTLAKKWECAFRQTHASEAGVLPVQPGPQRGTEYHALWEHDVDVSTPDGSLTETQADAVRLYRWYRSTWGSPELRFGLRSLGVEVNADAGPDLITLRVDTLYEVVDPAPLAAHGVLLNVGDRLIHDHKTASSAYTPQYYLLGLQGRYYPAAFNRANPTTPVAGMLFDEIVAHKDLRLSKTTKGGKSWNVHWAPAPLDPERRLASLRAYVADTNALNPETKNEKSCVDMMGTVCPLYSRCHGG